MIEHAEALGEPPEDPLLLFSVLYGFWAVSLLVFNGDAVCELAAQFLTLAEKQRATAPLMIGHCHLGHLLRDHGRHHDRPGASRSRHSALRSCGASSAGDAVRPRHRATALFWRAFTLWVLGYPEAAQVDADHALKDAREIGQAATLMGALVVTAWTHTICGNYEAAKAQTEENAALADEKAALYWKALGMSLQGWLLAQTGDASDAIQMITSGIAAMRSTGATSFVPWYLLHWARAYAELGQFDEAWRRIGEAMSKSKQARKSGTKPRSAASQAKSRCVEPKPDVAKAEAYFERALTVAREQQAKSWELRAAMSMARLWRDQGKPQQARELLAPVYGWFTEGFDTLDLKEAKALLDELAA